MTVRVLESSILYQGKLKGVREVIQREDGKTFVHETIRHPGAVVILPVAENGDIVLINQYRHSVGATILEVPAGTLEIGEDPAVCARRELSEEIGMAAREWTALGEILPAPGFCDERQYFFFASGLYLEHGQQDEDEVISTFPLSVAKAEDAIRSGRINDGKTLAILMRARLQGLI